MQILRSALNEAPDLREAHEALADHYAEELLEAEEARDPRGAARAEALLRQHDRGRHAVLLAGDGALTLATAPEGAQVSLHRYVERDRRLVPELARELGPTPLIEVALPRGSYLLEVRAPGYHEAWYPVLIERGRRWDGVRPGGEGAHPVRLLRLGELGEDDLYVPAGWFLAGGDPDAGDSLPRTRLWCDGFIVRRHPVTNAEYLTFLNALVASGREAEALECCPRLSLGRAASGSSPDSLRFERGARRPLPARVHPDRRPGGAEDARRVRPLAGGDALCGVVRRRDRRAVAPPERARMGEGGAGRRRPVHALG